MTYYEDEMPNEMQNDINEIKEILKRMQKSIDNIDKHDKHDKHDKLESNSSVMNYSVSYGTEINTIPLTQACSSCSLPLDTGLQ